MYSYVGTKCLFSDSMQRPDACTNLRKKRPDVNPEDFILHQDNAPAHTASATQLEIDILRFQRLRHPPYTPDLAPMDFHVFSEVKSQIRGVHFSSADELVHETQRKVSLFDPQWYRDTYSKWVTCHMKCIRTDGDYIEKV